MKTLRLLMITVTLIFMLSSCSVWNSVFKPKYGCPGNGKNIGAEKLLDGGDAKAEKEARKAKKFKS